MVNHLRCLLTHFQVHVVESSTVADHCRNYALSDPKDSDFQRHCGHLHNESCAQCSQLQEVLDTLESECSSVPCNNEDKEEMMYVLKQANNSISSWKAHQLRSVHQAEAKSSVLAQLDSKSVFLVQDWAMKYMPRKFWEAQSDWFAKRGLPWHITVAIRRSTESNQFESLTFVHVFQNCAQDSAAVVSIMQDCLTLLKKKMPELEKAYYKQDNAGCYHSGYTIVSAKRVGDVAGVDVVRNDFSDPQGGKGICDRKAANIKGGVGRFLNEGHDVTNALELKAAIESGQETTGVEASYVAIKASSTPNIKWDGISLLNNFEYEANGIRAWRAFNVGPGKLIPWSQFGEVSDLPEELEIVDQPSQNLISNPSFRGVTHRHVTKMPTQGLKAADKVTSGTDKDNESEQAALLFPCPEEGCVKSYTQFSSLQTHLDTGKHKRRPEHETLYDKAKRMYASKLTDHSGSVHTVQLHCEESPEQTQCFSLPPMGWALKKITKKTRFTEKQNEFLKQQFEIGEQCGRKADPNDVSKLMRSARDEFGGRRFKLDEVLTPQQVSSFFSRLAAQKRLATCGTYCGDAAEEAIVEDQRVAQLETCQSNICTYVMREVSLQHPIVTSFGHNICDLVRKNKLKSLNVEMLRRVCSELEIDVTGVAQRRKSPYISRLNQLVNGCRCSI